MCKKIIISIVVALAFIGCSDPVSSGINEHTSTITVGLDTNISYSWISKSEFIVHSISGISTTPELYFYILNDGVDLIYGKIVNIPDGTISVDGHEFTGLDCIFLQDVYDNWYVQIIRNHGNLSMSVGAKIEINEFTVKF